MRFFRLVILLVLCLSAGYLAVNSYQQWEYLTLASTKQISQSEERLNMYRDGQAERLATQAAELQRELEFNLWPDQQQVLFSSLLNNIKTRIERSPFEGLLWLELINTEQKYGIYQAEYSWNLINAIRQNEWQEKAFALLAHHCIHQKTQLSAAALIECKILLSRPFATKIVGNVKKKLGIDKQQFEQMLQEARTAL